MIIHFAHFFHISWLHVFLQWIPFARHATVALMFHILAYRRYLRVDIRMWKKSVKCAIFAPVCCIHPLGNSRLVITILTTPTLVSTDSMDHCGCETSFLAC
jgi:hypothetical protein